MPALLAVGLSARAEEIDYKKLYSSVSPAVVLIYGEQGEVGSVGTGSIIHRSGLVVTNAHVILNHDSKQPFPKLFVFLKPERVTGQNEQDLRRGFKAQLLVWNAALDLALVGIEGAPDGLPVVPLAEGEVGVGEATAAIGHPEHGAKWSLTTGRIGGEWANFEGVNGKDVYQMETSVNRGNSGGPLLDGNGYMVGINTSIARRSEDGLAITGINFALKSSVVRRWLGEALPQIEAKKGKATEPPPPPQVVAAAEPQPLAPERKEAPPPEERADQIAAKAKPGAATQALPPAPPAGKRGYASSEPPGKTLSPLEAARWHAKQAFDSLDEEERKHQSKKAGK
jgi:serine protease Do